jgi:hypothetical protein
MRPLLVAIAVLTVILAGGVILVVPPANCDGIALAVRVALRCTSAKFNANNDERG